jgi:hypothetical protein
LESSYNNLPVELKEGDEVGDISLLNEQGKRNLWNKVLSGMKKVHPVKIYPYLKEGQFLRADNEEFVIGFPKIYTYHRSRLEDVSVKQEIEEIMEKVLGLKIGLSLIAISDSYSDIQTPYHPQKTTTPKQILSTSEIPQTQEPSTKNFIIEHQQKKLLKNKVLQNEQVIKILESFNGKIVDVRQG